MTTEDTSERKGKSNAILTYELLSEFNSKLTRVDAKMDHLADKIEGASRTDGDHEVRLRALELTAAGLVAGQAHQKSTKGDLQWMWQAAQALASFGLACAVYFRAV